MEFGCALIAVADMERSKRFYHDVLGLEVAADFGANVILAGGLALQTLDTWRGFIEGLPVSPGGNAFELYFEEEDMEAFLQKLAGLPDMEYVHPLKEHTWGQRALRFFDPDKHIIEVGESMDMVIRRFLGAGLTMEETAARMDVPLSYVQENLKRGEAV